MSSRKTQKQINRELKRITENIPKDLLAGLLKNETVAPTLKMLLEKAIALPDGENDMTPEKRDRFKTMLASGVVDRNVQVIDRDVEKLIEAWIEAELALAVKLGRLPKEAPMPDFIKKKGKKYARKQAKRLEELFSAESAPEEDDRPND